MLASASCAPQKHNTYIIAADACRRHLRSARPVSYASGHRHAPCLARLKCTVIVAHGAAWSQI